MKAMVLSQPSKLALEQVPQAKVGPGQALVRVTHTGVCGTDLKIYSGAMPTKYPRIMGHELVGELIEGSVDGIRPGSRVIVDPCLYCGHCYQCRAGQTSLCPNGGLLGREADGGFAEYTVVPVSQIYALPDSIDAKSAPLIQVLTTCLHGQRITGLFPAEAVAVLGLGVSGQLHVAAAKVHGGYPVIGITRSAFKRQVAEKMGADITIRGGEDTVQQVMAATSGRGADLVIECTGTMRLLADAINMARPGGRILTFGITTTKEGNLPFYQLYFKELAVYNSRAAKGEDFITAIDLVKAGMIRLEPLVTHVMPLAELDAAIGLLHSDDDQRLKIIMDHAR